MKAYSITELAQLWSVSYHTIWRAVERGDLAASRLGVRGGVRILEADAMEWWKSRQIDSASKDPMPRPGVGFSPERAGMLVVRK
jgi:excisionase family DNA binding protein